MKTLRLMMLLATCCATSTVSAAEPTPAKPAVPAPAQAPAQTPPQTPTKESTKAGAESAAAKSDEDSKDQGPAAGSKAAGGAKSSAADKGSSPQRFVPSEQVRADFDVSFPIDI